MTTNHLISVKNLTLQVTHNQIEVVKNVSFDIAPGEIFGIVGESGSGKSLATRALIALLPPAVAVTKGSVVYKGKEVLSMSGTELRRLRGGEIGMVFQEPHDLAQPVHDDGRAA